MQRAERFSGRVSTWLAMLGVAIGLGNVWRFPYMMGAYGGSAFLLLYIGLTLLFAFPVLVAEYALGRASRSGVLDTYRATLGRPLGTALGLLLIVSILVADSYYTVVIGNIVYTTWFSAVHGFSQATIPAYQTRLADGQLQFACSVVVLAAGSFVIWRGVNRGIERVSRWFVPTFGAIVLYMVGYAFNLEGSMSRVATFLAPNFDAIGIREVFAALGHACFSLSVGGTFMVVYGNLLADDDDLPATALVTAFGDLGSALLAALFLVPTILYFGVDMASGPSLIFNSLPRLFAVMPLGRLLGTTFLLAFIMMGFLSAIAGLEVGISGIYDLTRGRIDRPRATVIVALLEGVLLWPSAHSPSLVAALDLIFGSGMQILGAIVAVVALTWGLGTEKTFAQIFGGRRSTLIRSSVWWLRWVVPVVLLAILALYVADSVGHGDDVATSRPRSGATAAFSGGHAARDQMCEPERLRHMAMERRRA
jgi:neurotransmitter:Na+ symporter, NSS family